jgi:hypothetical protein
MKRISVYPGQVSAAADQTTLTKTDQKNITDMVGQLVEAGIIPDAVAHEPNPRATAFAEKIREEFNAAAGHTPELSLRFDQRHDTVLYVSTWEIPECPTTGNACPDDVQARIETSNTTDWNRFYTPTSSPRTKEIIRPRGAKP